MDEPEKIMPPSEPSPDAPQSQQPVDVFFRVMLVMSMVNAGMSAMSYLITGVTLPLITEIVNGEQFPLPEEMLQSMKDLISWPQYFFLIMVPFWVLSFLGALRMWKYRVSGFHCYTLAQMILLLLPLVCVGKSAVAIGDIMFTVLFIVYYALKIFKNTQKN